MNMLGNKHSKANLENGDVLNYESERFKLALSDWSLLLAASEITLEKQVLESVSYDCGFKEVEPLAILSPSSIENLQALVEIAYKYSVPVHVSSRGKNWGYGSSSPIVEGCVLIELKNLNKIIEVNQELAYAVIEPGVTQQQLYDYLQRHAPNLSMDITGASPESSLIGNLCERGYGQSPYGDRFQNSSGMEVLLANGKILRTGFWRFKNSKSHHLYKWGIGPYIDGLFTQSNFGIVTKVGLWLMPKPKAIGLLLLEMDSDAEVVKAISKLRDLKLRGLLPATVHISNDIRLISCFDQFPYDLQDSGKPLSDTNRKLMRKKWDFSAWTAFTSLRGSREQIRASLKEIKKELGGTLRIQYVDDQTVKRAKRFGKLCRYIYGKSFNQIETLNKLVSGQPTNGPSLGAYWRHPSKPQAKNYDPVKDRCGISWCAPVIPSTSADVSKFLTIVKTAMEFYGFESNLTLTMITDRSLCCTIAITYRKDEDSLRAQECYKVILDNCMLEGFIPYRHGININDGEGHLFDQNSTYWKICNSIKSVIDDKHILSPGKYGIW